MVILNYKMAKNNRIDVRVNEETLRRFDMKANQLGLSRTKFIDKIANEPIIFLDNVRQTFIKNDGV